MNRIVGDNLKILRKSKNLSQEQVADYLYISQSAYARMERGESISWATHFNKICQVFEITPEELVKKELGITLYENLMEKEVVTTFSDLRKIIKKYELEIEDLKTIIRNFRRG